MDVKNEMNLIIKKLLCFQVNRNKMDMAGSQDLSRVSSVTLVFLLTTHGTHNIFQIYHTY